MLEQTRNAYLVSSSMKKYLIAAIASMLIQNLNTIIDGVLMGRFLGSAAFSAINLCLPVVGAISTLATLFFGGATVLASLAMGARQEKRTNDIFTVSVLSVAILSAIVLVLALLGLNGVTSAICREDSLRDYVKNYLFVYFAGAPITMVTMALLAFTDVGGKPKLVTVASVANIVANILGDLIYVGVLGIGIRGAALATLTGSLLSVVIIIVDSVLHGSVFRFQNVGKGFAPIMKEIIQYGIPMMSQSLAVVIYTYVCTICSQQFCGVNGAFVGSLLVQATTLCQGVSGGIGKAFGAIGGMLKGQKDDVGVGILYKKGMTISVVFSAIFAAVIMVFAAAFAMLMGAETPEIVNYSTRALRMALPFVVPITIVWIMPSIYAISGELSILPVISISQPVLTGVGLVACAVLFGNDNMWLGYPISAVLILLLLVLLSEGIRKKANGTKAFLSLLPVTEQKRNVFDISVECDPDSLVESVNQVKGFFSQQKINEKQGMRVRLCVEEMMINIIEHAGRKKKQFLDLKIVVDEDTILAIIKDDGRPFNPINAEDKGAGLKLLNGMCQNLDYSYAYGQNMLFMNWEKI